MVSFKLFLGGFYNLRIVIKVFLIYLVQVI